MSYFFSNNFFCTLYFTQVLNCLACAYVLEIYVDNAEYFLVLFDM